MRLVLICRRLLHWSCSLDLEAYIVQSNDGGVSRCCTPSENPWAERRSSSAGHDTNAASSPPPSRQAKTGQCLVA